MSETNTTFTPQLQHFSVSFAGASIGNFTFVEALKFKHQSLSGQGEIKGHLKGLWGALDIDGAILYDGSTWLNAGDHIRPILVNGIEY